MLFEGSKLRISESTIPGAGRGVFAVAALQGGELLEECHYAPLVETNFKALDVTVQDYVFTILPHTSCIVFGHAMVYNNSAEPNVGWEIDLVERVFRFRALRDVAEGSELFINYRQIPKILKAG